MNNSITFLLSKYRIISTDIVIFVAVYFIPALSHLLPIPLYMLDPMRILLFISLILSKNYGNTLIIGATIPIFSSLITGHPVFAKSILISIELFTNIFLLYVLISKTQWNKILIFCVAIIVSKLNYYFMKYLFIKLSFIGGELISTPISIQLITSLVLALLFSYFVKKEHITSR
jgi:hypothetical protein